MGKRAKEGHTSSWETFAWERRSSWRIELGFDALESLEEVACVQIWRLGAAFIHYFLESFQLGGGRTTFSDCFLSSLSSSHQNWEISVALGSELQDSHSCGGDSSSEVSVAFQSRSGSLEGRTTLWASDLYLSLIASSSGVAIVPGSLLYCIYCFRSLILRYIHHIPKLVFPRGVLSRVLDQKYLCLHMHFSGC